ncbi:diaminopimelate epimerase [Pseudomonadota bacterium]
MKEEISDIPFIKMHGLGNDFVIIDNRSLGLNLSSKQIKKICDRNFGIGCDEMIVLEHSDVADVLMKVFNHDGTNGDFCVNGARCVACLITEEKKLNFIRIQTNTGFIDCKKIDDNLFSIDMGKAHFHWKSIPMSKEIDTNNINLKELNLSNDIFECVHVVNVGNPHCVLFLKNKDPKFLDTLDIKSIGPRIENHILFPRRTNVEFIQIISPDKINMRIWERGSGETLACGSGSCAVQAISKKKKLTNNKVQVMLKGGNLFVEVDEEDNIIMTGAVKKVFHGVLNKEFLSDE